ncbi:unnamed protein product [Cuscuta epithymum]|uniref:Uncharacterized protein n=1 Tax=Cuscuta epithymum TaxID=186058 RepID=A0AAV0E7F8_9ASTE|nr:unnamed protein product [Cuscuta epithymum]
MDCLVHNYNFTITPIFLHYSHIQSTRTGRRHCASVGNHFPLVGTCGVCIHCIIHLSNVPSSTEQEHYHFIFGSRHTGDSHITVLAFDSEAQVWTSGCHDFYYIGILDS